jgi:CubicO group peptidase (beta-lactamase class C family)
MLRDRHNPYASYTIDSLLDWLSKYGRKIKLPLKEEVHYSNMGMALLGFILAQKLDTSYEQAILSRVCAPLGLGDTRITLTPDQKERLSVPHSSRGAPAEIWDLPAFLGAGALLSTANDLLSFLDAHLGAAQSSLAEPIQACHEIVTNPLPPPGLIQRLVASLIGSKKDLGEYHHGMALGWNVGKLYSARVRLYWHHGATGGYRAFIGFAKDSETAVVVLANSGLSGLDALLSTTSTDTVGFKAMELLNSSDS